MDYRTRRIQATGHRPEAQAGRNAVDAMADTGVNAIDEVCSITVGS